MEVRRGFKASAVLLCAVVALASCSMWKSEPSGPLPSGTLEENLVTATAIVKKIDLKTRKVTLERADGSHVTFVAGEQVRNLPQVKVGDTVTATFYDSVAFAVKKPGDAAVGAVMAEQAGRAEPGEKPAAAGARVTTVTAKITAIDKKAGTVTLTGPDGEDTTVKVRDPNNLDRVTVGDLVEITLTEAVGIAVEPQAK